MSDEHRTPYTDDMLRVEQGTGPEEIREFVRRRALNPLEVEGVTIWNFNNHEINMEALERDVKEFNRDEYVIPYQASGVWGYMVILFPKRLQEAEILAYQQDRGRYIPYPNYIRHSWDALNYDTRRKIKNAIAEI